MRSELTLQREAGFRDLSPSIHWAQKHQRAPSFAWSRRIYDFELLYVAQGEINASIQGRTTFVLAGSLLFIPAGAHHQIEVITEPHAHFLGIHFDFFDELEVNQDEDIIVNEQAVVHKHFCAEPIIHGTPLFSSLPVLSPPLQAVSLLEFLINEWNERPVGYELACKGLLLQIFSLLCRHQNEKKRMIHPKYRKELLELAHDLEHHYQKRWTSTAMAKYLNVHEDYLSKLFTNMMGMSPNKYLQSIRHQAAKKLLRETDYTIEVIAEEVGYGDLHYFSRVFKKWEGMSAQMYRRFSQIY